MRILVASGMSAGSFLAHAINVVKMAEGFAKNGHDVTLLCRAPMDGVVNSDDLARSYGLEQPIRWRQLSGLAGDLKIGEWIFALVGVLIAVFGRYDLVYARNYILPRLTATIGIPTVAETHAHDNNLTPPFLEMLKSGKRSAFLLLTTISLTLAKAYARLGMPEDKICILSDAVDISLFSRPSVLPTPPFSKRHGRPVITYTGHLYDYKGIPTLLAAAAKLVECDFHLVGGLPEDIQRHTVAAAGLTNVFFHGLKPLAEVPPFQWHSDVLVLPPSANHPSAAWTSPLKLGEYLASGVPVVATRIPALLNLAGERELFYVAPDNPDDLADGLRFLLANPQLASNLAQAGRIWASRHTYTQRAESILKKAFS